MIRVPPVYLVALVSAAIGIPLAVQAEEFKPLSLKADSDLKYIEVAVAMAFVEQKAEPLIVAKLDESDDLRESKMKLTLGSTDSEVIPLHAQGSAEWRYLKKSALFPEQWTDVDCTFDAVLRLTSNTVSTAKIEISNPDGIAKDCKAHGDGAKLLGDAGVKALTAAVNHQLGTTPVSEPVIGFLNQPDARDALKQYLGIDTLDDATSILIRGCEKKGQSAICITLDAP